MSGMGAMRPCSLLIMIVAVTTDHACADYNDQEGVLLVVILDSRSCWWLLWQPLLIMQVVVSADHLKSGQC